MLGELQRLGRRELGIALGVSPNTAYSRLRAARVRFSETFAHGPPSPSTVLAVGRGTEAPPSEARQRVWLALGSGLGGGMPTTGLAATAAWSTKTVLAACTNPDAMGVFASCEPQDGGLHEISRYTDYLVQELRANQGKEVVMLGIVGVPPVVAHDPAPPYQPTAGGVLDLVYRDWIDAPYPAGDILPNEWNEGITAVDKQFQLEIGPGCTGTEGTSQASPPGRIIDVCQALDVDGGTGDARPRCCLESICDAEHDVAIDCLMGLVQDAVTSQG